MTWQEWHKFLNKQHLRLRRCDSGDVFEPIFPFYKFKKLLKDREWKSQKTVDRAIKKFSAKGRWPALTQEEKYFLKCRLTRAIEIMRLLSWSSDLIEPKGRAGPKCKDRKLTQWLLITSWTIEGSLEWQNSLWDHWVHVIARKAPDRFWEALGIPKPPTPNALLVREIKGHPNQEGYTGPAMREYFCAISLDNGQRYSITMFSDQPPSFEYVKNHYKKHPDAFTSV